MKAGRIITAGALMLASLGIGSAANAHDGGYNRWDGRGYNSQRHDDRRYRDHRRYDDRRYSDYRGDRRWNGWRSERRCWTEWRYNHRVRVCR